MRFAISAGAAVSGLFLLALAFYGQPAVYLREARDQWDELMDRPVGQAPAISHRNSEERAAQPQHDAAPLNEELAQRQDTAQPQAPEPLPPAPSEHTSGPRVTSPSPGEAAPLPALSAPPVASVSPLPQPEAPRMTPPTPAVGVEPPPALLAVTPPPAGDTGMEPATAPPEPVQQNVPKLGRAGSEQAKSQPESEQIKSEPAKSEAGKSQQAKAQQARAEPPKPEAVKREQAKSEPSKPEPPRPEQVKSEPPKSEPKPPAATKTLLAQKAPTAPPPLLQPPVQQPMQQPTPPLQQQPSQPPLQLQALSRQPPPLPSQPQQSRQQSDDTQSVLARLRQLSPATTPSAQADISPAPEARTRQTSASPLPRLNSARAALASGQIEDARRLLQQVQLQLVFGPIDTPADAPQAASKGAIDVARALDALSANDVSLSRRYVDVAVGDLSGIPTNLPIQQSDRRVSGYAPAYPPR